MSAAPLNVTSLAPAERGVVEPGTGRFAMALDDAHVPRAQTHDARSANAECPMQSDIRPATQSENAQRFERLAREHCKMLWRLAQRLGVDAAEAEDITQRVLLIAAERIDDLIAGKEKAFLVQTAVYVTRKVLSARHRRLIEFPEEPPATDDEAASVDEQVDRRRAVALLDLMLQKLPEKLREPLVLFELEGHSQSEIAQLLGLPSGTVASRLRRGRERFLRIAAKHKVISGAYHE